MAKLTRFSAVPASGSPTLICYERLAPTEREQTLLTLAHDHMLALVDAFYSAWSSGAATDSSRDRHERQSRFQSFMTLYRTLEQDLVGPIEGFLHHRIGRGIGGKLLHHRLKPEDKPLEALQERVMKLAGDTSSLRDTSLHAQLELPGEMVHAQPCTLFLGAPMFRHINMCTDHFHAIVGDAEH